MVRERKNLRANSDASRDTKENGKVSAKTIINKIERVIGRYDLSLLIDPREPDEEISQKHIY